MKTAREIISLVIIAIFVMAARAPLRDDSTATPFVNFSQGRLSIRAVDVSLEDLLEEIRKKSGIVVELRDQKAAEKRLTLELINVSPGQAFEEILRGFSFAFFYNRARLAQVVVLSPDGSPPLLSLSRPSSKSQPAKVKPPQRQPSGLKPAGSDEPPDFEQILERNRAEGMKALSEALVNPDSDIKSSALEVLTEQEGPDVIPVLSGALRDPDPEFRMEVLEALADKGELQLVRSALSDQNTEVREKAAELLEIEGEGK